jgi:hypothetical protein
MKNNWILRLKVHFRSWKRKTWRKIEPLDVLNPKQQLAFDIFKIALKDENNIFYLNNKKALTSEKMYIVSKEYITNNEVRTFIMLEYTLDSIGQIIIVNHEYKYDIDVPQKTAKKMLELFELAVSREREKMEKEIMGNITSSLEIVLEKFKEKMLDSKINPR